jgi:hypothetical protein
MSQQQARHKAVCHRARYCAAERKEDESASAGDAAEPLSNEAPVTLAFRNITCVIEPSAKQAKAGQGTRTLLNNVSGVAKPGRLLAVRPANHMRQPHA